MNFCGTVVRMLVSFLAFNFTVQVRFLIGYIQHVINVWVLVLMLHLCHLHITLCPLKLNSEKHLISYDLVRRMHDVMEICCCCKLLN